MRDFFYNAIPLVFIGMVLIERFMPARRFPSVKYWTIKGLIFFVVSSVINTLLPPLWVGMIESRTPVNLTWLGMWAGGFLAFLLGDFMTYLCHRLQHKSDFLWRWTHQLHHSAERLDVVGSLYFHPLDSLIGAINVSLASSFLGISTDAAAFAGFLSFFYVSFGHWNVKTPRWLGVIIQRPEAHCLHHQRGLHDYNYGPFPLWDFVFRTYRNPATWEGVAGFWDGASRQVTPMLFGKDVSKPPADGAEIASAAAATPAATRAVQG
jgi:sterol desaturase/sphingolipid hydroxylase (fatty acid hydroxylase superfamily)